MKTKITGFSLIAVLFLLGGAQLAAQEDSERVQEEIFNLINKVRKNLLMITDYGPFDHISFSLAPGETGYTVTLKGYAAKASLKDTAENAIKKIESVGHVENQIEVLPLSPADESIRMEAYIKIYGDHNLSRYNPSRGTPFHGSTRQLWRTNIIGISQNPPMGFHPISIIVKNGHLTLEGVVDTEFDKNIAGVTANRVKNVFSVTNNLVVPPFHKTMLRLYPNDQKQQYPPHLKFQGFLHHLH